MEAAKRSVAVSGRRGEKERRTGLGQGVFNMMKLF